MDDIKKEDIEDFKKTKGLIDINENSNNQQQQKENSFEANLLSIQQAAAELVSIQDIYKSQGKLNSEQKRKYSQSLEKLGISAQKLANIQGSDDDIRLLLEGNSLKFYRNLNRKINLIINRTARR